MEKIKPIELASNHLSMSIPLAFDESTSFQELLYAMNYKLTEVINDVNEIEDVFNNIDVNFDAIYEEIANIYRLINETSIMLERNLKRYTDLEVNNAVNGLNAMIENVYTTLDTKIDNTVVGEIEVLNPTNGQMENINKVLGDIYNANRVYAITCTEFDNLELTATEYDNKQITAYDFDNFGLEILN